MSRVREVSRNLFDHADVTTTPSWHVVSSTHESSPTSATDTGNGDVILCNVRLIHWMSTKFKRWKIAYAGLPIMGKWWLLQIADVESAGV